jgi:hypothetical protein
MSVCNVRVSDTTCPLPAAPLFETGFSITSRQEALVSTGGDVFTMRLISDVGVIALVGVSSSLGNGLHGNSDLFNIGEVCVDAMLDATV